MLRVCNQIDREPRSGNPRFDMLRPRCYHSSYHAGPTLTSTATQSAHRPDLAHLGGDAPLSESSRGGRPVARRPWDLGGEHPSASRSASTSRMTRGMKRLRELVQTPRPRRNGEPHHSGRLSYPERLLAEPERMS